MVKVGLHYEPSSQRKSLVAFFCKKLNNAGGGCFCFFFNLPSIDGLEWPDINWPIPVSGDHHPFIRSHTTHDVIHASDDGNFGKTNDSILKVFRFF